VVRYRDSNRGSRDTFLHYDMTASAANFEEAVLSKNPASLASRKDSLPNFYLETRDENLGVPALLDFAWISRFQE
jgi:hypothetical protein